MSLAVYNVDLALVRDVRQLTLPAGTGSRCASRTSRPPSTRPPFTSARSPSRRRSPSWSRTTSTTCWSPDRLLRKYVGREITLVRDRQESGTTRAEEVKALLLAYNNGPVWKIGNEIVTGRRVDEFRFPELPENLFSHPTLVWMLENAGAKGHRVEASYLTGGLAWNADYVLTVARDDRSADLAGWVTLQEQQRHRVPQREAAVGCRRPPPRPRGQRRWTSSPCSGR